MAFFIALLTPKLLGATNVPNALQVAFFMWLAFVITSMIQGHRYGGQKWSLTIIDGGYLLVAMLLQAVVIGLFG
jgi:hypothetical protein